MIFELFLFYLILSLILFIFRLKLVKNNHLNSGQNVLIVTAHPDDETMFFGPTIISKLNQNINISNEKSKTNVFLLCFSNGNYYGIGKQRTEELEECCRVLDIKKVSVIEDNRLEDMPNQWWDQSLVRQYIIDFVENHGIDCVISFDDYGISGHINHRVLYRVLSELKSLRTDLHFYCLQSISILRKYLSIFEFPITLLFCLAFNSDKSDYELNIISFYDYLKLLKALHKHKSQMLWFRYLYCFTSRYMFINQLIQI